MGRSWDPSRIKNVCISLGFTLFFENLCFFNKSGVKRQLGPKLAQNGAQEGAKMEPKREPRRKKKREEKLSEVKRGLRSNLEGGG